MCHFLIYAPEIVKPARISDICSQLDVAPTIMHLLGGSYEHCFFGSSVLAARPDSGFAWILNDQQLIFINGLRQGVIISPGDHNTFFTFSLPDKLNPLNSDIPDIRLRQMPISILQVAASVFENGTYNLNSSNSLARKHPSYSHGLSNTRRFQQADKNKTGIIIDRCDSVELMFPAGKLNEFKYYQEKPADLQKEKCYYLNPFDTMLCRDGEIFQHNRIDIFERFDFALYGFSPVIDPEFCCRHIVKPCRVPVADEFYLSFDPLQF